jgi:hypothetical protein
MSVHRSFARHSLAVVAAISMLCMAGRANAQDVIVVRDASGLQSALRQLRPGNVLKIAPGDYPGDQFISGIQDLTIEALDAQRPPLFQGGSTAWQFSRCGGLTLRHLKMKGQRVNGLNLDDGGQLDNPVLGITLEHLEISDVGPRGNHDGIKCSGLQRLTIRDCTITGWGGQGIDFVGCHQSLISGCRFIGKPGFSATAGVQLKGGSSDIVVERCRFENAGERPLNIGGSTGLDYFRPAGAKHEAARIIVRENTIDGSPCAAAFVGVDGAEFVNNTIRFPTKWIFRILQETRQPGFIPCRDVRIRDNSITFRRADVQTELNIGVGTAPETFQFSGNHWFAADRPEASRPKLPVAEQGGVYAAPPK